jgi:hypothetical protein
MFLPALLFSKHKNDLVSKLMLISIYISYLFLHIDSGPDHEVYRWYYSGDSFSTKFEPIFSLCYILAKLMHLDYDGFLVFFRLLNAMLFSVFILKAEKSSIVLFLAMYIPFSFVTFELNLLRQSLSLHFGLIASVFYLKNRMRLTVLFIVFAILSHVSAVLMLFIFVRKFNRKMIFALGLFVLAILFNYEYIALKFIAYNNIGDLMPRFDGFVFQLILLLFLPFVFFKFPGAVVPISLYVLIVGLSFIPVLVRLYPIALLLLLPYAKFRYSSKIILVAFISMALCLTVLKTYLLIQYDRVGVEDGVIKSGYVK